MDSNQRFDYFMSTQFTIVSLLEDYTLEEQPSVIRFLVAKRVKRSKIYFIILTQYGKAV